MTTQSAPKAGRKEWVGLAVLTVASMLVSFDVFVLLLALPHLTSDLALNSTQQLWVVDIYGFMVGGFLVTMGTLGDRIGRRRLLMIGAVAFGAASVLAAFSTGPQMLIIARALLGVAGATLAPSTLALISNMFLDPKQKGMAIGLWAGSFTLGAIIGPITGGMMLEYFWWGSVFLLAVPAMVLLLILGPLVLPEYRAPEPGRIDLVSVVLSLLMILPFVYGVKEVARIGWDPPAIAAILLGAFAGTAFVRRQLVLDDPLLDLRLFRNDQLTVALVSMLMYSMLTGTTLFYLSQFFQSVLGLSPFQAALALIPGLIAGTVSVTLAPVLARWIRPAVLIAVGLLIVSAGLLMLLMVGPESGVVLPVAAFVVWCLGGGPGLALGMNLVIGGAPPEKAGSAASLPQIGNEMGTSLGIATVGTLGAFVYGTRLDDRVPSEMDSGAATDSVAGAVALSEELGGTLGSQLESAAQDAFTSGLHVIAVVSAVILVITAALVLVRLRHVPPMGDEGADGSSETPEAGPAKDAVATDTSDTAEDEVDHADDTLTGRGD
ncbi:MAG TPA: MFS transporter [Nocardiopsis listeri]|uniref:MFS transporter n=1 Tax=Nocardiopsis listeri TaxID=53440 RepID=UPI001D99153E|nr:MFS transporter [Nocardiopsis listeri]HJE61430.1 MFS transporter [Nocardiopsis listeri]